MKGHVETPAALAEHMTRYLFEGKLPEKGDRILYPGCGRAPFAAAVEKVCSEIGRPLPEGHAVEMNPELLEDAQGRGLSHVTFHQLDFLSPEVDRLGKFDYVIGNPPYVAIEGLDEEEKRRYRSRYHTASGRMDLYFLFFEQGVDLLTSGGRLSFITPEKWTYVESARDLRRLFASDDLHLEEIVHVPEDAFEGLITYPSITTVSRSPAGRTTVKLRDGTVHTSEIATGAESWASAIRDADLSHMNTGITLDDISVRISAGVATGRDRIFVRSADEVSSDLRPDWTYPTVSGKELKQHGSPQSGSVFICAYREDGTLVDEDDLGAFGDWAIQHRDELEKRSCVKNGKRWYSWHENPPMQDILRPKILFRDVTQEPEFWADYTGNIVPRHTVYYLVPAEGVDLDALMNYLQSLEAREWMEAHCQRAANGYMRLQSRVLKKLPVPEELVPEYQGSLALSG